MSSDPFRKWSQGDEWEPSAAWLNTVTDAARQVQQSLGQLKEGDGQLWQPFTPLRMRNSTNEPIPRLGVVQYAAPFWSPTTQEDLFVNHLLVEAHIPSSTPVYRRFAIALQRVEKDAVFWGAIGGVVPCRVTGRGDYVASIIGDVDKLQAGDEGVPLIWSQAGEEERFGICRIDEGQSCSQSYDLRLLWMPSEAILAIQVRYREVTESISLGRNTTREELKAAIDAHSKFVEYEVECIVEGAGDFPSSNMLVTLPAGALIVGHSATMVRADLNPHPEFRVDVCGCRS